MDLMPNQVLLKEAQRVIGNSYAPYSNFKVAAVLQAEAGKLYPAVNVESSSYRLTVCAEEAALACAVSSGEREFKKILVYSPDTNILIPCGACLQMLSEFNPNLVFLLAGRDNKIREYTLKDFLPHPFKLK